MRKRMQQDNNFLSDLAASYGDEYPTHQYAFTCRIGEKLRNEYIKNCDKKGETFQMQSWKEYQIYGSN